MVSRTSLILGTASSFALYYVGHGTDFLSLNFQLASQDPRADLYAVTFHKGPGTVQATIYSSPEHGSMPMVVASNEKRYGASTVIKLPAETVGSGVRTESLTSSGFASNAHTFSWAGETFEIREEPKKRPKTIRTVRVEIPSAEDDTGERPVEPSKCHSHWVGPVS